MDFLTNLLGLRRGFFGDWRIWAFVIPALAILSFDLPVLWTLLYSVSAIFVIVALAHIARRILFHYIDLEKVAEDAMCSPTGSGLVYLGTCFVIVAVIIATAIWIAH